jgi:hypothetical protein
MSTPAAWPEADVGDLYRYVLELFRTSGEALSQVALTPDWEPAVESARFTGLRSFGWWTTQSGADRHVDPLWDRELGEPYVGAFRVHLAAPGGPEWFEDFPATTYFGEAAREAAAQLVESGSLNKGDRAAYRLAAFARPSAETVPPAFTFDSVDRTPPLVLRQTALSGLLASSAPSAEADSRDAEVLLPHGVVDEATALTREAGAQETGGILIGHLHRDPATYEIFLEVTAQIPARHTRGDAVRLTFTSDTWTDVRTAIALRRRDEMMLGWWHSHPAIEWCKTCSPASQRVCHLAAGFLSAEDRALHRAMFPRAFGIALVMTHAVTGIGARLFGWRSGVLEPRGFRLLGAGSAVQRTAARDGARRAAEEEPAHEEHIAHIGTGGHHAAPTSD